MANPFHNILRLSAGDFVAKTLNFLAFVYLARVLGVVNFGVLEFANSLLTWFLLAGDGGLEVWGTREAASARADRDLRALVGRVVPLRFLLATAAFVLLILILPVLPQEQPVLRWVLALFGLSLFAQALNLKWVFMGQEKMTRVAAGLVVGQIVFAVTVFVFVRRPEAVLWVPLLRLASDAALAAYFAREFAAAHGSLRLPFTLRDAGQALRPAVTIGTSQAMGLLNFNFNSVLLGFLKGLQVVGWYNAAYKPVTIALAFPLTYFIGLFPALSRTYAESREAFCELVSRSFRLCSIFAVPLGVGGTLLAAPIIGLLFGAAYVESVRPLQILVWSAVFVILRGSYRHSLTAAGHQQLDLRCAITSTTLNVGLNVLLIPRFGMTGAASATAFADVVWFLLAAHYFHHRVMPLAPLPFLARPLLAGLAMGAWLWLGEPVMWIARGAIGVVLYFAVLLVLQEPEVKSWINLFRRAT